MGQRRRQRDGNAPLVRRCVLPFEAHVARSCAGLGHGPGSARGAHVSETCGTGRARRAFIRPRIRDVARGAANTLVVGLVLSRDARQAGGGLSSAHAPRSALHARPPAGLGKCCLAAGRARGSAGLGYASLGTRKTRPIELVGVVRTRRACVIPSAQRRRSRRACEASIVVLERADRARFTGGGLRVGPGARPAVDARRLVGRHELILEALHACRRARRRSKPRVAGRADADVRRCNRVARRPDRAGRTQAGRARGIRSSHAVGAFGSTFVRRGAGCAR